MRLPLFTTFVLCSALSATAGEPSLRERLADKLIALSGDKVVDAESTGDPEYFVFYHSASW